MKRLFMTLGLFFLFSFALFFAQPSTADVTTPRYATCDACGFCVNSQEPADWPAPPSGWAKCQRCLYPNASENAGSGDTLVVDEQLNIPPTPKPGQHYTVFGCIKTDLGDFTQTGAASSLVQVLLNIIFTAAGGIALLYIIYGSFVILTSQAEPERLAYGKRLVMGAIIGLILALSSVFVVNLLANGFLKLPGFGPPPTP